MKKSILTILTLAPSLANAQAISERTTLGGGIAGTIIGLVICILIFLALRQIFLWYWKIETIIANQHEQTRALQALYNLLDEDIRLRRSQTKNNKSDNTIIQ